MSTNTNVLHEYAEGRIQHLNRGQCPDIVSGHDSRDPDCPVCAAITTAAAVPPAGWRAFVDNWMGEHDVVLKTRAYEALLAVAPKAEPVPAGAQPLPLLVRDIAADLSTTPIQVCKALADLGFGGHSLNMAVTPQMAESLRAHFGNRYCAAGMCLEADGAHDACCQRNATQAAPAGFEPGESRINAQAEPVPAGEYPPLPSRYGQAYGEGKNINDWQDTFNADQMRAYVDDDRAMRAQAAPAAVAGPSDDAITYAALGWGEVTRYKRDDGNGADYRIVLNDLQRAAHFVKELLAAAPTTQAAPQPADEDEGMTREQWIEQAMRVYLIAGDAEDDARECAKELCGEQNWDPLQDDLADPYDAAMSDVEGRGQAPQPAVQQGPVAYLHINGSTKVLVDASRPLDADDRALGWVQHGLYMAPQAAQTESVLIDGTAYETPAPVAAELLRLHLELMQAAPQPAVQQGDDCRRCHGSGEDPEGYYDQSRGPNGNTYDGPCRVCAGTGAHPEAPAAQGDAGDAAMFTAQHQFLEWNREQGADRPIFASVEYAVFQKAIDLYRAARSQAKEGA